MFSAICTNSPVFGMYLSLLFACNTLPASFLSSGMQDDLRADICHITCSKISLVFSQLTIETPVWWNPVARRQDQIWLLKRNIFFFQIMFSVMCQKFSHIQKLGAISIRLDFAYEFFLRILKLLRFTQRIASFSFHPSGPQRLPSLSLYFNQRMPCRLHCRTSCCRTKKTIMIPQENGFSSLGARWYIFIGCL